MEQQITQKKPQRSFFGKLIKWTFIGFNLLMLFWMIAGVGGATKQVAEATTEAEKAGGAIGTGLGAMMIIFIWVAGDVILGIFVLLTRAKK
jgi:hypothetical protein